MAIDLTQAELDAIKGSISEQLTKNGGVTDIRQGDKSVSFTDPEKMLNVLNALEIKQAKANRSSISGAVFSKVGSPNFPAYGITSEEINTAKELAFLSFTNLLK